eukprot:304460_1
MDHNLICVGITLPLPYRYNWSYMVNQVVLAYYYRQEASSTGEYYYIALHPDDDLVMIGITNDSWSLQYGSSYVMEQDTPYTLTVNANGPLYDVYIGNHLLFGDVTLDAYDGGTIGLKTYGVSATFLSMTFEPSFGDEDVRCGDSSFLSAGYAIGDDGELFDDIKDICESDEFQILVTALSIIPRILTPVGSLGTAAQAATMVCKGISFVGVLCDIFDIDECSPVKTSASVVASCWSSNTFSPRDIDLDYAFQSYLDDNYGVSASFHSSDAVEGEVYRSTQVTFDNCGRDGNHFIAGIYDVTNNAEQNDIVSGMNKLME